MSKRSQREQFIVQANTAGLTYWQATSLLRHAATLHRLAEAQCNGDYPADNGERKVEECPLCGSMWVPSTIKLTGCPDCRAQSRVRVILNETPYEPEFSGDPRGCVVKIFHKSTEHKDRESGRATPIYVP